MTDNDRPARQSWPQTSATSTEQSPNDNRDDQAPTGVLPIINHGVIRSLGNGFMPSFSQIGTFCASFCGVEPGQGLVDRRLQQLNQPRSSGTMRYLGDFMRKLSPRNADWIVDRARRLSCGKLTPTETLPSTPGPSSDDESAANSPFAGSVGFPKAGDDSHRH